MYGAEARQKKEKPYVLMKRQKMTEAQSVCSKQSPSEFRLLKLTVVFTLNKTYRQIVF